MGSDIKFSKWMIIGRMGRFGITISSDRLRTLHGKRLRQLARLIEKFPRSERFRARLMATKTALQV